MSNTNKHLVPIYNPRLIRVFYSKEALDSAVDVIRSFDINTEWHEDRFQNKSLADFGMVPRFKLYIDRDNVKLAARYLAKKLLSNK